MEDNNSSNLELGGSGIPAEMAQPEVTEQKPAFVTADDLQKFGDSMFANMRRMMESMGKPKGEKPQQAKPQTNQPDFSSELALRDAFDDAIAGKSLPRETVKRLRKSFMSERPEDAGAWVDEFLGSFGVGKEPTTAQGKDTDVKKPIVSDAGAAIGTPVWERPSNPFSWTEDDVQRIYAQKGQVAGRKFIRERAEQFLRGKRITGLKPNR